MEPVEEGRIEYPNGDEFEGETLDGMPVRGKFQFKSELSHRAKHKGDVYEGEFKDGTFHGKGVYHYLSENHLSPGDRYEGHFAGGDRHGEGTYHYQNGDVMRGVWSRGWLSGVGRYDFCNGDAYEGPLIELGIPEGEGVYTWSNGDRYEGQYKQGKRTGPGTYYHKDGTRTEGDFVNGEIDGIHVGGYESSFMAPTRENLIEEAMELKRKLSARTEDSTMNLRKGLESPRLEFKASLWTNFNDATGEFVEMGVQGKKSLALQDAVIKTVAGFMNTEGGTLLIGVRDKKRSDGDKPAEVLGIEPDYQWLKKGKQDSEGFETALRSAMRKAYSNKAAEQLYVDISFPRSDGKEFCRVDVKALPRVRGNQLYTKTETMGDDKFFTRSADSTLPNSIQTAVEYINRHFDGSDG